MKQIFKEVIKLFGKSIAVVTVIGIAIGILGYVNEWDTSIKYSNAFFIAGCLMIIAGASSRYAASQGWNYYQLLDAESFRNMSSRDRVDFIIKTSSSLSALFLGILSGLLLIVASAVAAYMF